MPSTRLKKAATSSETEEVLLTLLRIYVDRQPVLHLVDNTESIVSGGEEYIPCSFGVILPQESSGIKKCRLSIDNSDVSIYEKIKSSIGHEISCDVSIVLASSPDVIEQGPLRFVLRNVQADVSAIQGELYDSYMNDRKFTTRTYSPADFPGMFF